MISERRLRDYPTKRAAQSLADALAYARRELPPTARVCVTCHHVFAAVFASDLRCAACVADAAEQEARRV